MRIHLIDLYRSLHFAYIVRLISEECEETGKWKQDEKGRLLELLPFLPAFLVPGGLRQSEVMENCIWLYSLVPLIRIRFPVQKQKRN